MLLLILRSWPRSMERFQEYLNTITNEDHSDVRLAPLVAVALSEI